MPVQTSASSLDQIRAKVEAGQRLSAADGLLLFSPEVALHQVGELADLVRQRRVGNVVYFNINAHLNPTNVCLYQCALCAYSCDADVSRAYVMSDQEILDCGQEAVDAGCTEMHIVGGVHPSMPFGWYVGILRRLHEAYPQLHLKAFTAVEIDWMSRIAQRPVPAVLETLMAIGLSSLPGGGAEIFDPTIRRQICPGKADARTWLAVHKTAHQLGLHSNATMLYGHLEEPEHRIDHLIQLRTLQDETGGFQAMIPLSFHPEHTRLDYLPKVSGLDDLRTIAVSRLMLDNFAHIKAYWIALGVGTAQAALGYGADDLDGTVRHERIYHDAGAQSPEVLSLDEIRALILEAGREPVERDSLYRRVARDGKSWRILETARS